MTKTLIGTPDPEPKRRQVYRIPTVTFNVQPATAATNTTQLQWSSNTVSTVTWDGRWL